MNKIKYIIQILAVIFFWGCAEDEFTGNRGDIQVVAGFATTRTTFVEDNGTTHVTWNTEDAIGLFTDEQSNLQYTAMNAGSETQFSATGDKLKATEGKTVYAYYPYSYRENQQRVKLPNLLAQNYKENASEQDFIYASDNVTNNKLSLQFKHLFAFLKITIPMEFIADRGKNGGLYIHSTEEISCDAYFDLGKEEMTSERYNDLYYYIPASEELEKKEETTCYIAILPQPQNAELKIYRMNEKGNECLLIKKVSSGGFKAGNVYTLYLNESLAEIERDALTALYKATNGDKWIRNDNWCSDKPLSEWYGINCNNTNSNVWGIYLGNNNLTGALPAEIGNLPDLETLFVAYNEIGGNIPPELGNLKRIRSLALDYNKFSGNIPEELGNLSQVETPFNISLGNNNLTGEIPESIGELKNLVNFSVTNNMLSGPIPKSFMQLDFWQYMWPWILGQDGEGFDRNSLILPGPKFSVKTYTGESLGQSIYEKNKYTILLQWRNLPTSTTYIAGLKQIYNNYKKKGIEIVGYTGDLDDAGISAYASKNKIPWPMFWSDGGPGAQRVMLVNTYSPAINIVDTKGSIVIDSHYTDLGSYNTQEEHLQVIAQFFQEKLGDPDPIDPETPDDPSKPYVSTDYSKDGNVTVLQKATEGNGIDIVLIGDIFSDRLIADGTYETTIKKAADYLFTEEPFKSFRNLFNVYMVDAVSKNEVYGGETALNTYFGNDTFVGGDNEKCFEYAQKAISDDRIDEAMIVVMINSTKYAGTCYMYTSTAMSDYGSGPSVSYFPIGNDDMAFEQTLHHEACGHGFSKLADEYAYQNYGAIPASEIQNYQSVGRDYGWYKNVDFTSDPTQVKWSKYLSDSRYSNDGLGVFEGACTYWTGAYRPTNVSIMRYNTDGFNAPSREAIYYRIHKLAYGTPWAFNYEDFVTYDAINRKASTRSTTWNSAAVKRFRENHCPPVVIRKNWRNAK